MLISMSFLLAYRFSISSIYIASDLAVSSLISDKMNGKNGKNNDKNKFYYHGHLISGNINKVT